MVDLKGKATPLDTFEYKQKEQYQKELQGVTFLKSAQLSKTYDLSTN